MVDPLEQLRQEIEEIAADETSPDVREARLGEFRRDLVDLLGNVDTYLGDTQEEQRGQEGQTQREVLKLRENAEIRERLIAMGDATAEACDDLLLYSHDELDLLAEEGLLEETAAHVASFMGALSARKFDEAKHPRGRGGKFAEVFNKIAHAKDGQRVHLGGGVQAKKVGGKIEVHKGGRKLSTHTNAEHAARSATSAIEERPPRRTPRPAAPETPPEPPVDERNLPEEEKSRLYHERRAKLEQRASATVAAAARRGKLTDAEAHFNDAGKVSQRTLAAYVDHAKTKPQTVDLYSTVNSNGERVWDQSRRQLHERIITAYLKQRTPEGKLDYSPDAPDLQPHPEGPQALFSGGGYAAGKGSVLKILGARGDLPPDSFTLDPDQIKAELPEFQAMIGSDPEANMHVYQEAWAIAQEVQARAQERKLNIVVDGISNTSPEEMGQRAKSFTDRGYTTRAVYVDIPTEEAMKRAANRAINAKAESDRRMIPEIVMRSVHRDVGATVPSLPGYLREHGVPLDVEVWDNNQGKDDVTGQFRPPKQMFSFSHADGSEQVLDQGLWDSFRRKGSETILHVDA
jgi:hypothetical protein